MAVDHTAWWMVDSVAEQMVSYQWQPFGTAKMDNSRAGSRRDSLIASHPVVITLEISNQKRSIIFWKRKFHPQLMHEKRGEVRSTRSDSCNHSIWILFSELSSLPCTRLMKWNSRARDFHWNLNEQQFRPRRRGTTCRCDVCVPAGNAPWDVCMMKPAKTCGRGLQNARRQPSCEDPVKTGRSHRFWHHSLSVHLLCDAPHESNCFQTQTSNCSSSKTNSGLDWLRLDWTEEFLAYFWSASEGRSELVRNGGWVRVLWENWNPKRQPTWIHTIAGGRRYRVVELSIESQNLWAIGTQLTNS